MNKEGRYFSTYALNNNKKNNDDDTTKFNPRLIIKDEEDDEDEDEIFDLRKVEKNKQKRIHERRGMHSASSSNNGGTGINSSSSSALTGSSSNSSSNSGNGSKSNSKQQRNPQIKQEQISPQYYQGEDTHAQPNRPSYSSTPQFNREIQSSSSPLSSSQQNLQYQSNQRSNQPQSSSQYTRPDIIMGNRASNNGELQRSHSPHSAFQRFTSPSPSFGMGMNIDVPNVVDGFNARNHQTNSLLKNSIFDDVRMERDELQLTVHKLQQEITSKNADVEFLKKQLAIERKKVDDLEHKLVANEEIYNQYLKECQVQHQQVLQQLQFFQQQQLQQQQQMYGSLFSTDELNSRLRNAYIGNVQSDIPNSYGHHSSSSSSTMRFKNEESSHPPSFESQEMRLSNNQTMSIPMQMNEKLPNFSMQLQQFGNGMQFSDQSRNYKGLIQEMFTKLGLGQPKYTMELDRGQLCIGPRFKVHLSVGDRIFEYGEGSSKKVAEQEAAKKVFLGMEQGPGYIQAKLN